MSAKEAREMMEASLKADKRLMINFSYRFREGLQALKNQVESGIIGDIYFGRTVWHRRRGFPSRKVNWFFQKEMAGGGAPIDVGIHRLALALWLMAYPKPVCVMGSTYNHLAFVHAKRINTSIDVDEGTQKDIFYLYTILLSNLFYYFISTINI